jgi:hypothetical protein
MKITASALVALTASMAACCATGKTAQLIVTAPAALAG